MLLFQVSTLLLALQATNGMVFLQKGLEGVNLGTFEGQLPQAVKVVRVTKTVAVPYPYPVPFNKHIPVPVSVPKPVPYAAPQVTHVQVTKPVIIQQAVPFEVSNPFAAPQLTMKSPQPQQVSFPSELLMAPQFNRNQEEDFKAYLSFNGGSPSFSSSSPSFSKEQHFNVHQLFGGQDSGFSSQIGFGSQTQPSSQVLNYLSALDLLKGFGSQAGFPQQSGSNYVSSVGAASPAGSQGVVGAPSATDSQSGVRSQSANDPQIGFSSQSGFGRFSGYGSQNIFISQNGFGYSEPSQGMSAPSSTQENAALMMTQAIPSPSAQMQIPMQTQMPMQAQLETQMQMQMQMMQMMLNQAKNEAKGTPEISFGHNFESSNSIDGLGAFGQFRGY